MSQTAKDAVTGTFDVLTSESQKLGVANFVWDTGTLAWIRQTPSAGGAGGGPVDLLNVLNGQDYPIILAQNEGVVVRVGSAQPAAAVQQTAVIVQWLETNKAY